MKKSIIQPDEMYCFNCGRLATDRHHIFMGKAYRPKSDKYGLTVYLCKECHQGTSGVHGKNGHKLDLELKQIAQREFEKRYGHEKFMEVFGKNYL